jgi:two-component system response regulator RegX3
MAGHLVVVEDEATLADSIRYQLEREGWRVTLETDGARAVTTIKTASPDLIILDVMLPGVNGLDICREIRGFSKVPILMLTAKDSEVDKVTGLELGADDYVTKPFSMRELIARVRALSRRSKLVPSDQEGEVAAGGVNIDIERHRVTVDDQQIELTPKEFELLSVLVSRAGKLVTRDFLMDEVWGPSYFGDTKTLDVHIKRLRSKVEKDPANPIHILTVRGLGYRFE